MTESSNDLLKVELGRAITEALAQLPGVQIDSVGPVTRADDQIGDLAIAADVKGRPVRFLVEIKASGYPRDVQRAIWQFAPLRQVEQLVMDVPIVAAPAISQTSRELLRRHSIGYWDTGGSLYVDLPWALYWLDRPVPAGAPRLLRSVYHGSTASVLHALLLEPHKAWHITELAERVGVSASTTHQVCMFLEQQLWMEREGKGPRAVRLLREPGALLDAWAAEHSLAEYAPHRFYRWSRDPSALIQTVCEALTAHGVDYALTLDSGAQQLAPFGTNAERVWLLVPASAPIEQIARAVDLRAVEEGESVTFLVTREPSPLLFRQRVGELCVASDVQLYLDLWTWPRRGKEQARHLRAERLRY
ncbi:MAG: hypothetical protein ACRDJE_26450 [Dehalococcoidia bacterium]